MDFRDSYSENRSAFPGGRQNWNMEFKDAASAAQAAAESADRAAMAARAAAEFSNRENIARQYSSGSRNSPGRQSRDEAPKDYAFHDEKHLSSSSINSTIHKSSSGMHNEQITAGEEDNVVGMHNEYYRNTHQNVVKHSQTDSTIGGDDKPFTHGSQIDDVYHHNNLFKQESDDLYAMSIRKQASRTEEDFGTEHNSDGDINNENNHHYLHARTNTQPGDFSSSHPIFPSDDHNDNLNSNDWTIGNKAAQDLFVAEVNIQTKTMEPSSYNDTSVVFDDSESDDDDFKFDADKKYKGDGSGLFFSSLSSKSQVDPFENTNSWSYREKIGVDEIGTQSLFSGSEKLTKSEVSFEKKDSLPATFDDSDDPSSDIETDLLKSRVSGTFDYGNSVLDQTVNHGDLGSISGKVKNLGSDRKSWSSPSSVGSDNVEEHSEKKVDITNMSEKNYGYDDLPTSEPFSTGRRSTLGLVSQADVHILQSSHNFDDTVDTETLENSHVESGTELDYGTLKGGFRNKGYRRPSYIKNTSDDVSTSLGNISVHNERSLPTVRTSTSFGTPGQDKYTTEVSRGNRNVGLRTHNKSSDSDRYDLDADSKETTSTHELHVQNEPKKKSSSRASIPYFDSDDSGTEDELHKKNLASVVRPVSRVSRRTSASPKTVAGLSSNHAHLDAPLTPGSRLGWKSSRDSYKSSETGSKTGSVEYEASKPISEPNRSFDEEVVNSSARVQSSSSPSNAAIQDSEKGQKASKSLNSDGDTPTKKKADHVHPKLPDYDSFAAHFMSLKKGGP